MSVAVRIQISALALLDAAGGILFGVELDKFGAVSVDIAEKRDIMGFFHRVRHRDIIVPVALLDEDAVFLVTFLRFEGRQSHTAAGIRPSPDGLDDIAADGTDIELHFADVGGTVAVDRTFPRQKLRHGHAERGGKLHEDGNIGQTAPRFPFGNGLVADIEPFGKLLLREGFLLAQCADGFGGNVLHKIGSFLVML